MWTKLGTFSVNTVSGYKVADALYLPVAGFRASNNGRIVIPGSGGYYWNSSNRDISNNNLYFSSSRISPTGSSDYSNGFSVRCIPE